MKQMVAPEAPSVKKVFLRDISGNFFRRVNDPEGKIFYGIVAPGQGFFYYSVLNDGRFPECSKPECP